MIEIYLLAGCFLIAGIAVAISFNKLEKHINNEKTINNHYRRD